MRPSIGAPALTGRESAARGPGCASRRRWWQGNYPAPCRACYSQQTWLPAQRALPDGKAGPLPSLRATPPLRPAAARQQAASARRWAARWHGRSVSTADRQRIEDQRALQADVQERGQNPFPERWPTRILSLVGQDLIAAVEGAGKAAIPFPSNRIGASAALRAWPVWPTGSCKPGRVIPESDQAPGTEDAA